MSDQSLDKSKCIDGSYGWVVVLFTMLVGFVPGSNMAKAISLAPLVCMNFQINEATFGLIVASFYIMGFIMAFPTTYVFDRNGRIVGEPLLGGIDNEKNLEMLQKTMDEALARDSAVLGK